MKLPMRRWEPCRSPGSKGERYVRASLEKETPCEVAALSVQLRQEIKSDPEVQLQSTQPGVAEEAQMVNEQLEGVEEEEEAMSMPAPAREEDCGQLEGNPLRQCRKKSWRCVCLLQKGRSRWEFKSKRSSQCLQRRF
ncbi:uncharacterized protein LOC133378464 isoform X2 [Rhineura floridana]|uniref:uncharacterized protein LOC133378464 isoform X2 n=1 Tax=Rhineura floridana TaxID=261503 RepID=UPI002AC88182|nr:uncharacterized protein LOC133378464 isoform X2 [Rhineura floridana]